MRMEVLRLYKRLLRESQKFPSYNYRNYFLDRVKHGFRENKALSNQEDIKQAVSRGTLNLNIIRRQVLVGQMYQTHKLVIENV